MGEYIYNTRILIKSAVLIFTLIGLIGGLTLLIIGGSDYNEAYAYRKISGEDSWSTNPSLSIMLFGSANVLISIFGGFSIQKERKRMILSYTGVLFLVAVSQIGFGIGNISRKDDLSTRMNSGLYSNLKKYSNDSNFYDKEIRDIWNIMQKNLHCCGARSYENWGHVQGRVPESCCQNGLKDCSVSLRISEIEAKQFVYTKGCSDMLIEFLLVEKDYIAAIITGLIELCVVFLTYFLDHKYRGKAPYTTT